VLTEEGVKATADPERARIARPLEENFMMFFFVHCINIFFSVMMMCYCIVMALAASSMQWKWCFVVMVMRRARNGLPS
jgi:hypothetical protein